MEKTLLFLQNKESSTLSFEETMNSEEYSKFFLVGRKTTQFLYENHELVRLLSSSFLLKKSSKEKFLIF
jgi:hypothetical protein